jgi:hypothetical protein
MSCQEELSKPKTNRNSSHMILLNKFWPMKSGALGETFTRHV